MNLPVDLKFKNEDERISTMEAYSKEADMNPSEFDRIMAAPVETPDPTPPPEQIESEEFSGSDAGAEAAHSQPAAPTHAPAAPTPPSPAPASGPAQPQSPAPAPSVEKPLNRNWNIKEDDIPKDTYFDTKEQKVRPFITHNKPEDVFKTLIHGQKRIHYLEDVLLPQEKEAAAQAAKAESQSEIERLKAENEQLKKGSGSQPSQPSGAAPTPQPIAPGSVPAPQGNIGESAKRLQTAREALKGIDRQNAIEHTDKMMDALMAALDHVDNLTANTAKIQEDTGAVKTNFQKIEDDRKSEAERLSKERERERQQRDFIESCNLIDRFAQNSPNFKDEYGSVDQTYIDMTKEAVSFHTILAGILFNKHPNLVQPQEQAAACMAYLKGDEKLLQATQQYGINEPKNYRAWVELDQVDAMRNGWVRDPSTKQWLQIQDPVTRKPVHLGDMETAYGRYLDVSGKRQAILAALLKNQQEGITNAITRRDRGVTSMDTNRLGADGAGNELTDDQAAEIFAAIDPGRAQMEYIKTGNRTLLDRLNQAFVRMGMQPLEIPDITVPAKA